jgi:hypothetical protein
MSVVSVKPASGGRLMSGVSSDTAGIMNYVTKRDFRRYMDREVRSEGYDQFNPLPKLLPTMPPTTDPITLITQVENPNGHRAVVVGTAKTLYRYYGLDDPFYAQSPGATDPLWVDTDYYQDEAAQWVVIGDGFSTAGHRWEAVNINGYLVLNNGVDLPVTYRERDLVSYPITELRENGVVSVGSIADHNGILMCMDIRQRKENTLNLKGAVQASVGDDGVRYVLTDETTFQVTNGTDGVAGNILSLPYYYYSKVISHTPTPGGGLDTIIVQWTRSPDIAVGDRVCIWDKTLNTFVWRTILSITEASILGGFNGLLHVTLDGAPILAGGSAFDWPSFTGTPFDGPYIWEVTISDNTGVSAGNIVTTQRELNWFAGRSIIVWNGATGAWVTRKLLAKVDATHWTVDGAPILVNNQSPWYWSADTNNDLNPYPSKSPDGIRVSFVHPSIETLYPSQTWALDPAVVVGLHLTFSGGQSIRITDVVSVGGSHYFETDELVKIPLSDVTIENPILPSDYDRYQWRVLWSRPNEPRMFGAIVTGTITPTENIITLDAPTDSFTVGQSVKIVNTSDTGQLVNLTGTITQVTPTQLWIGGGVITNAGSALVDAYNKAKAALKDAQTMLTSATSALDAAQTVLKNAQAAADADPTNTDLAQAVSDAQADVTRLTKVKEDAGSAVVDAQTALDDAAKALEPQSVSVEDAESAASIIAFEDLIDDGSAILRGLTLRNYFIIYKETAIFIARYTGQVDAPFVFEKVPIPDGAALHFSYTLVDVGGLFHFFASPTGFFRFDLTARIPQEIPEMMACKEMFFRQADADVFAADNSVTREVFICLPNADEVDATLRYDYMQGTVATSAMKMTGAATVPKPTDPSVTLKPHNWFVMGGLAGLLLRYGFLNVKDVVPTATATAVASLVTASAAVFTPDHVGRSVRFANGKTFAIVGFISPTQVQVLQPGVGQTSPQNFRIIPAIWHRDGAAYDSVIESGMEAFGAPGGDKTLTQYVLILDSHNPGAPVSVGFRNGRNAIEEVESLAGTIASPQTKNLLPLLLRDYYLGDRVTLSGVNNPVEITERLFDVNGVNSKNFGRQ